MKKYMCLCYGFEKPTPEIMQAWNDWFNLIQANQVERGHFSRGVEISKDGTKELPLAADSITGFVTIQAASFEEATQLAEKNPYIHSIRVYELM